MVPSYAPQRLPAKSVVDMFNSMTLNPNAPIFYDPSIAPPAKDTPIDWRQHAASIATSFSQMRRAIATPVCTQSALRKSNFKRGMILSIPHHTPNMNPNVKQNDPRLRLSIEGPVYSKRRMVVVLWRHSQDMTCLPLYPFGNTGLIKKQNIIGEYVSVMNASDKSFVNQGKYAPVEVQCQRDLTPNTSLYLMGEVKVGYSEDIGYVSRVTETSFTDLCELWYNVHRNAMNEKWRP